jgi:GrpB-like predicted nucleotidyltransferase (UPF0157 family)
MPAMIYKYSLTPRSDILGSERPSHRTTASIIFSQDILMTMERDLRDTIELVEYDPVWPEVYEGERHRLAEAFLPLRPHFEHIGSTAVPGLCAKPIIDIMVGVPLMQSAETYTPLLEPLGYCHVEQDEEQERVFYRKGMPRTHHVHIVTFGSVVWHRHLAFRELLREDTDLRERYAQLKRQSAKDHCDDREAYVRSKDGFIQDTVGTRRS